MRDLIRVNVVYHSGYKADEYSSFLYWDNIQFDIKEIQDLQFWGDLNPDLPPAY